jgi:hypothetical protein
MIAPFIDQFIALASRKKLRSRPAARGGDAIHRALERRGGCLADFNTHAAADDADDWFSDGASPTPYGHLIAPFLSGVNETGHIEGENAFIEYTWA